MRFIANSIITLSFPNKFHVHVLCLCVGANVSVDMYEYECLQNRADQHILHLFCIFYKQNRQTTHTSTYIQTLTHTYVCTSI